MKVQEANILLYLYKNDFTNQRDMANATGYSIGSVNNALRSLSESGLIDQNKKVTAKALTKIKESAPRNAIILAAGMGLRMIPINSTTPKGLLRIKKETLIERLIKQLHEVGVTEIHVVVGFQKDQFEFLIDEYDVDLIINEQYYSKNNIYSLYLASEHISNTYIIPCDIWSIDNPFSDVELYPWYMVSGDCDSPSEVAVNRKMELIKTADNEMGNQMIGISYLMGDASSFVKNQIEELIASKRYDSCFWEEALFNNKKMVVNANVVSANSIFEINTYEQLRDIDKDSYFLQADAIDVICGAFGVTSDKITDISVLKKGMTNKSFLFKCEGKTYIMRIPGEGTDKLINRKEEASVYDAISKYHICDDVIYVNPDNGYKITSFIEGARSCDAGSDSDVKSCMRRLKELHDLNLKVEHEFNVFEKIEFYEELWGDNTSVYKDYAVTKANVLSLKSYIDCQETRKCLSHIDSVADNFLITEDNEIRLIDWEYAGMQDPHIDIAMFCIYSFYDRDMVDKTIDFYFDNNCPHNTRIKIYCYVAMCGLLWSNWCEYKRNLGIEFGKYSLMQYRYAKKFYSIVQEELNNGNSN